MNDNKKNSLLRKCLNWIGIGVFIGLLFGIVLALNDIVIPPSSLIIIFIIFM